MTELTVFANLFAILIGITITCYNAWDIVPTTFAFVLVTILALLIDVWWVNNYLQYRREKRREEKYKQYK